MNPQELCQKICKESRSNFVKTFYFLPKNRRRGFEAFYAFCRLVDDAVDEAASPEAARQDLAEWRQQVELIYDGKATHPVAVALSSAVQEFSIPRQYLDDIIHGCEMDLERSSYQSFDDLKTYCYHVASSVGLVCLHLFGADLSEKTRQAAIDLGLAVQLTNILRDILPDLKRGRVYLPQEDMRLFNITNENLVSHAFSNGSLLELIKFEMNRARSYYTKAWNGFPANRKERRPLIAATLMGRIYEKILDKIHEDPQRIFNEKVALSGWQKLGVTRNVLRELYIP